MTHRTWQLARSAAAVVACAALAAGCGLRGANEFIPAAEAGSIKPVESLEGVEIVVGSKNFTEQLILGKMAAILLDVAGADVTDKTNLAGSVASRQAQIDGAVDMVWEYTGTAWISYLGHDKPVEGRIPQWRAVKKEDLRENDLVWLEPSPMNNTYAFATPAGTAERLGISKLSDLKSLPTKELTFCVESEFNSRDDGFRPMLETYDLQPGRDVPPGNVTVLDTGVIYDVTAKGDTCNFGEVFTTDGRIVALDLTVLEDDRSFFPLYNVSAVFRQEVLEAHPALGPIFEKVSRRITTETMLELNARVDVDGEDPALVARDWLAQEGFVSAG